MEDKYIKLLLERCLLINSNTPLFIHYNTLNKEFVLKVVKYAENMGVNDIYLDEINSSKEHDYLMNHSLEDIKNSKLFSSEKWDEYAKKDAAFLILETEIPNIYDDIPADKISLISKIRRETKPIYKEKQLKSLIAWTIAAVSNKYWANEVFSNSQDSLDDFNNILSKICFLDKEDPIKEWNDFLKYQNTITNKLNDLKISKLIYKNNLGTNLEISLPKDYLFASASSDKWIVNLPSYEVFTSPDYRYTNGVVYASKPLCYNNKIINNIFLKFKDGKVIEYDASSNKDVLKSILDSDDYSSFLGEVALVNINSPIAECNLIFKSTLLDENASCHLALGVGFNECIKNGNNYSKEELIQKGINPSNNHVDFMIGTPDLEIRALTKDGIITIMKDGNIVI